MASASDVRRELEHLAAEAAATRARLGTLRDRLGEARRIIEDIRGEWQHGTPGPALAQEDARAG